MSPEMKHLRTLMSQRERPFGRDGAVAFHVGKVRAAIYALRHADLSREDIEELLEIADWCVHALQQCPVAVESVATVAGWVRECSADMPDDPTACLVAPGHNIADVLDAPESPWFIGPIGWVLTDVIALPEPVPCRGAQGLWTLPEDVERRVMAQVGGVV